MLQQVSRTHLIKVDIERRKEKDVNERGNNDHQHEYVEGTSWTHCKPSPVTPRLIAVILITELDVWDELCRQYTLTSSLVELLFRTIHLVFFTLSSMVYCGDVIAGFKVSVTAV
eukprot:TRINITY_DN690_c0_g1_i5.p3 TRINITY_DN690_c0_g1~~TRINITY_DN690_c0_g1_i5.p3  ORF type:complete len:114 (-),score=25.61 TRINITY_DN690_c0_g1_i5:149-490(-)